MIGLEDPIIILAVLLCLMSTATCVVYSWWNRHRGDDAVKPADVRWAKSEDQRAD